MTLPDLFLSNHSEKDPKILEKLSLGTVQYKMFKLSSGNMLYMVSVRT
jgi:hypothetical protein